MKKDKGFEAYLNELEETVDKLESGEADLDTNIEYYEKGMKLIEKCREILKEKKLKIEVLKKRTADGYTAEELDEVSTSEEHVKIKPVKKQPKDVDGGLF
ncbi:MAG: exodeoxyribonuclease VII small subunit [bacterium]